MKSFCFQVLTKETRLDDREKKIVRFDQGKKKGHRRGTCEELFINRIVANY